MMSLRVKGRGRRLEVDGVVVGVDVDLDEDVGEGEVVQVVRVIRVHLRRIRRKNSIRLVGRTIIGDSKEQKRLLVGVDYLVDLS